MESSPTFMLDRDYSKFTLNERVSLLRELYDNIFTILDIYFSGYLCVPDDRLNLYYLKLCLIIEKVVEGEAHSPLFELQKRYERPFESLYAEWGEGDIWWDDGGVKKRALEYKGAIDEVFIKLGEPVFVDSAISNFLKEVNEFLAIYSKRKKLKENQFEKSVNKIGNEFQNRMNTEPELEKKGKIGFIQD